MRIAQVTPVYPPYRGGIGAVAFEYAKRLRERGYEVEVLTPDYSPSLRTDPPFNPPFEKGGESVHHLKPLLKIGNAAVVPGLYRKLDNFDIVHLHYPFFGGAEFVAAWKLFSKKPLITTYHMDVFGSGFKNVFFRTYGKLVKGITLANSDRVLVSSLDYAKNSSIGEYVARRKSHVVEMPFGIDIERFYPNRRQPSLPPAGAGAPANIMEHKLPTIIFVGGLDRAHYFKGVSILLRALRRIKDVPWSLHIIGEGDLRQGYEKLSADFGLTDRVRFMGSVSDEGLPNFYQEADLHVLPAIDSSEAFGIVTLEAAASGLPSIVSDLPGVRSVIEEGKTGLLARAGDPRSLASALENLLIDHDRRRRMGMAARERVEEKYAWPKLIDKLEAVYRDC